jgi:hypothetical protein
MTSRTNKASFRVPAIVPAILVIGVLLFAAYNSNREEKTTGTAAQTQQPNAACGTQAIDPKEPGEPGRYAYPAEAIDPSWLEDRREAQLETVADFTVFCAFQFVDRVGESGITFRHRVVDDAARTYKAVHYDHGSGIAVADVDGDGLYDIYFVNQIGANQFWRNLGGGRFEDITQAAGVAADDRVSVGASFADVDNDGDPDLYVTAVRTGNLFFENDGTGKFTDVTQQSGLGYKGHSSGAVFFDYNRDGLLDLFLTNVGQYTTEQLRPMIIEPTGNPYEGTEYSFYDGFADAFTGHLISERAEGSILFKNTGENRFVDVTEEARLVDAGWSGDASPMDMNQDGWPDLYILDMEGNDEYYENVNGEYFVKKESVFGKTPWGAMGIKAFDYDNDGDMDVFITDMHSDMSAIIGPEREKLKASVEWTESFLLSGNLSLFGNAFYENLGNGQFREVSDQIGAENYWPWGLSVADLNADGFDDVFITASMNYSFRYGINTVLLNNRGEGFLDSEFILGVEPRQGWQTTTPWFQVDCAGEDQSQRDCVNGNLTGRNTVWGALGSRSSVIFDLDGDGDVDIVTNDFNSKPMVLISNLSEKMDEINFLKVTLLGTESNRSGLGATVRVHAGSQTYTKVHDGKSGYLSQSLLPLYFGLGDTATIDSIEVVWPSGRVQTVPGPLAANTLIQIEEP